eukprot:7414424-Pyramimonas_sp.AAC.1
MEKATEWDCASDIVTGTQLVSHYVPALPWSKQFVWKSFLEGRHGEREASTIQFQNIEHTMTMLCCAMSPRGCQWST